MNFKPIFFIPIFLIVLFLHIVLFASALPFENNPPPLKQSQTGVAVYIIEKKTLVSHNPVVSKNPVLKKKTIQYPISQPTIEKIPKSARAQVKPKIQKKENLPHKAAMRASVRAKSTPKIDKKRTVIASMQSMGIESHKSKVYEYKKESIPSNQKQSEQENRALKQYMLYINQTIIANKFYPKMAKKMGIEGKCILRFSVLNTGEIKNLQFNKKSSASILNHAARDIIKKIGRFQAFPSAIQREKIILNVPVKYHLKGQS